MAVATPFPVTKASGEIIKYGDVEKEREIEKRLKELGLWESKVYQEQQVEKMLEEKIDNSDKLSQAIKKVRRRRQRNKETEKIEGEEKEEIKKEKSNKNEGKTAMDEIRNIVKPTIMRDKSGMQLAYHIDIMMGCFTHDVSHRITNGGYMVVVFGATAPSSPLAISAFLSSKSLPSLLSPAMSPQAFDPKNSDNVNSNEEAYVNNSTHVGSTVRYGRLNKNSNRDDLEHRERKSAQHSNSIGHDCDCDDDNDDYGDNDDDDEDVVVDSKRLTKEISIELPRSVDASQLDVSYRKGVFKIRVPFFLLQQNASPTQNTQQEKNKTAQSQNHDHHSSSNQSSSHPPTKNQSDYQKTADHSKPHLSKTFTGSSFSPKVHLPQRLSGSSSSLSPSFSPSLFQPATNKAFHYSAIPQAKGPTKKQTTQSHQNDASLNSSHLFKPSSFSIPHTTSSSSPSSSLSNPVPQPSLLFIPPPTTQTKLTTLSVSTQLPTSTINRSPSSSPLHVLAKSPSVATPQLVAPPVQPSAFQSPLSKSSLNDSHLLVKKPFSNGLLTTRPPSKETPESLDQISTSGPFQDVFQNYNTEINGHIKEMFDNEVKKDLLNQNVLVKRPVDDKQDMQDKPDMQDKQDMQDMQDKQDSADPSPRSFNFFLEKNKNDDNNFNDSQYFLRYAGSRHGDGDNKNDACDNQSAPSNLDNRFQARNDVLGIEMNQENTMNENTDEAGDTDWVNNKNNNNNDNNLDQCAKTSNNVYIDRPANERNLISRASNNKPAFKNSAALNCRRHSLYGTLKSCTMNGSPGNANNNNNYCANDSAVGIMRSFAETKSIPDPTKDTNAYGVYAHENVLSTDDDLRQSSCEARKEVEIETYVSPNSLDELVLLNSIWSDEEDLDLLLTGRNESKYRKSTLRKNSSSTSEKIKNKKKKKKQVSCRKPVPTTCDLNDHVDQNISKLSPPEYKLLTNIFINSYNNDDDNNDKSKHSEIGTVNSQAQSFHPVVNVDYPPLLYDTHSEPFNMDAFLDSLEETLV